LRGLTSLALVLFVGCSGSESSRQPDPPPSQRTRDSAIGASNVPGASGVQGALKATDSAAARRAREDSIH
jgi:hypothetical protein